MEEEKGSGVPGLKSLFTSTLLFRWFLSMVLCLLEREFALLEKATHEFHEGLLFFALQALSEFYDFSSNSGGVL